MPLVPAPLDTRRCQLLGLVGSAALAAGGVTAGALPVRDALAPESGRAAIGLVGAYFGLVLLVAAWAMLGQAVRGPQPPDRRTLLLTLGLWAAPLLIAPPLFSRDVYSYLAQGAMVDAQIDVYTHGPSRLGGPLNDEVAPLWQHTPTPYGPLFLACATVINNLSHTEVSAGVIGMRLVALLGVAGMVFCLPILARHCGADPATAIWLGALNPLVLLHLVGGAHNDAIMLGLLGAGLVAALGRWPVLAVVLVTLATLVKAPAAMGLLAVALLWARQLGSGRPPARTSPVRPRSLRAPPIPWPVRAPRLTAALAVLGISAATTAATTAVTGTGYGWIGALDTPVSPQNWSITSSLGRMTGALLESAGSGLAQFATPAWHLAGLAATALAILLAWRRHHLRRPVYALGLSLTAVAVLGPAIRPWYVLWGLFLIAAAGPGRSVRRAVAAASAVLALAVLPNGFAPQGPQVALATFGGVLAVLALWCAHRVAQRTASRTDALGSTA
ncbi:polyprenol phosphomannose-dependent alpha 1,6 mannosyltransferase MptB [Streptomyces sp. AM8-1-1]|uniref:polyprenol phosphomannose-dependent alpha 1,6 mannosyltransferase MptB n=1 Tax=Streptomyces sp. AM8-1-1 TaxID=3075825 RepID=UPI0028C488B3|nr:polyprenol phosphomannose-dependent alpha 1,6 mannosyltransferase MptB [Streptomyces sp. AM8-1-1]WNO73268.1 polyprenol phosphomannose-dependent alpha 1,6 mannosyltransferase MptB [Streptomyces sp. AM8-1-1]